MKNNLDFLLSQITNLANIGPKIAQKLEKLVGANQIIDLLYLRPSNVNKRRFVANHLTAHDKELIITKLQVEYHEKPHNKTSPHKVICSNEFGYLTLVFFKTYGNYLQNHFEIGKKLAISGKIEFFNGGAQIVHPDFTLAENLISQIPQSEVIYPLSAGLTSKMLRKTIFEILHSTPNLDEWINADLVENNNFPSWKKAISNIHYPKDLQDLEPQNINVKRLAYDELLASFLAKIIAKTNAGTKKGRINQAKGKIVEQVIKDLPFKLTNGQKTALDEVFKDMKSDKKMLRLLQGDVGSGKTIIAFLAAILAKEDGKQAAIIVPISLLAQQHFDNFKKIAQNLDINLSLLTSRTTKANKRKILKDLSEGKIDIIIGTHALIYDDVIFKDLSLIVIDEQHRFGVMQRLDLVKKGIAPDVLLMSATPIPRSLMMTLYGDMDISLLTQKPENRIDIDTRLKSATKIEEVYQALERAIKKGEKIYWICPLIEESDELEFANVLEKYELFKKKFGQEKVALIHGKLKPKEKDEIMEKFAVDDSEIKILIATTVIEVGIDVKDATIIIIEDAQKFGLSQLHQLRGRVGRSNKKSYCLLIYSNNLGINGKKRLEIMRDCFDGFKVAEEDLKIRGSGEIFGTRQSGLPDHKFANLVIHNDLLQIASKEAQFILNKNPNLSGKDGENIKNLLRIFKYDQFIKLVKGG